jgi:hypothetical protein
VKLEKHAQDQNEKQIELQSHLVRQHTQLQKMYQHLEQESAAIKNNVDKSDLQYVQQQQQQQLICQQQQQQQQQLHSYAAQQQLNQQHQQMSRILAEADPTQVDSTKQDKVQQVKPKQITYAGALLNKEPDDNKVLQQTPQKKPAQTKPKRIVQLNYPLSPAQGESPNNLVDNNVNPWRTKVTLRNHKKPMENVSETLRKLIEMPEFIETEHVVYTKEEKAKIMLKTEISNLTLGLQPITKKTIENNLKEMKIAGVFTNGENHRSQIDAATIQTAKIFFRDVMHIPKSTRDQIKIVDVWNANKQDWNILYVKFQTSEDVSAVTRHAKNIVKVGPEQTQPKMLNYVPREFHNRFDYLEKLSCAIRNKTKGQFQTNTRMGRLDFIFRIRNKSDKEKPWKEITPSKIPSECPRFELGIVKSKHKEVKATSINVTRMLIDIDQTINNDISGLINPPAIDYDDEAEFSNYLPKNHSQEEREEMLDAIRMTLSLSGKCEADNQCAKEAEADDDDENEMRREMIEYEKYYAENNRIEMEEREAEKETEEEFTRKVSMINTKSTQREDTLENTLKGLNCRIQKITAIEKTPFKTPNKRTRSQNTESNKKLLLSESTLESSQAIESAIKLSLNRTCQTKSGITITSVPVPASYTAELQLPVVLSQGTVGAINKTPASQKQKLKALRKNP